jgi:hypothetical protein
MSGLLTGLSPNQAAVFVPANPNGVSTAPIGTIAVGPDGTLYQNTDGGTTWTTGLASLKSSGLTDSGELALTGEQTFSTTGTSNDVALNGGVSTLRLTGTLGQTVTGFTGGYLGRILLVVNEGTSTATFSHQTGSSATNQLTTPINSSMQLSVGGGALFRYDGSKWRVVVFGTAVFSTLSSGTVTFSGNQINSGTVSATSISGTNNDWAPTSGYRVRIAASAAATITGKATSAGTNGVINWLQNVSAFNVTLTHEGTGSTAANRFACPRSVDLVVPPGGNAYLIYDTTLNRWDVFGDASCWSQGASTLSGDLVSSPWASGRYYFCPNTQSTGTSAVLGIGTARAVPFFVPTLVTLTRIGAETTANGDAGAHVRLGIYGDDGTGRPGNLIVDAGQINGAAVGVQELTISVTIGPGWYWAVGVVQDVTVTQTTVRTVNNLQFNTLDIGGATPGANLTTVGFTMNSVTAALPSTWTVSATAALAPRIFVKT